MRLLLKKEGSIIISGLENVALPRKLFLYLSRVFTNASSHLLPLFSSSRQHVLCRQIFFPPITHWRLKEGRKDACSLETVSLLKDQAEVYTALQLEDVPVPPERMMVDVVPLHSYKAELSPTLNVLEYLLKSFFFRGINLLFSLSQRDPTLHQTIASKMTKQRQEHCKKRIKNPPLLPLLLLRW